MILTKFYCGLRKNMKNEIKQKESLSEHMRNHTGGMIPPHEMGRFGATENVK